ncbi:hypothetical protein [Ralstonia pseudosolanacearum]|uniref:hypothetical protein n=1 Tax=Ralstonia pseudosolanacearum TaxID=1310165 RepID=UPI001FF880D2|nr:hypothetical protein [Ralstonia pseudosolanacearum]
MTTKETAMRKLSFKNIDADSIEFACIFQGQTLSPQVLQSGIQLAETNINQTFEPAGWRSLTCRKQTPNNLSPIDCPD